MNLDINTIKKLSTPIAEEYGVKKMSLFGSFSRNDFNENSDIDIHLIDYEGSWGLFKLLSFESELENALGRYVDVITTDSFYDEILENVLRDEVIIYEAQ